MAQCERLDLGRTEEASPVVIVVPPVLEIGYPAIGPSILAAACRREGIRVRVIYPCIDFAARIGIDLNSRLVFSSSEDLIGEAIFCSAAFPERLKSSDSLIERIFQGRALLGPVTLGRTLTRSEVSDCTRAVVGFVSDVGRRIASMSPRIVAFSSLFQQNLASIAIARAVKALSSDVVTVLGGANAREPMASALLRITDAFDYVFSGEADNKFPEFCRTYLETGHLPQRPVIECEPMWDLDSVATPAYDDYFAELIPQITVGRVWAGLPYFLPFESSRGCWYASKKPCTFCAFNTTVRTFRAKSCDRILAEMRTLAERYGVSFLWAVDNVIPPLVLRQVLPQLIDNRAGYSLAYEVRPDLSADELETLARAGVKVIQPGIESLSSGLLALMGKGSSAPRNIMLLRNSRCHSLDVIWNLLVAVPGERPEDYEAVLRILPSIEHLQPPHRLLPILFHRYSAYHENPARFGIRALRPLPIYALLYGKETDVQSLAHDFAAEFDTVAAVRPELWSEFEDAVRRWMSVWAEPEQRPRLTGARRPDGTMRILDTRRCAPVKVQDLPAEDVAALDSVVTPTPEDRVAPTHKARLERLVAVRLVAAHEGQLLSLVTEDVNA